MIKITSFILFTTLFCTSICNAMQGPKNSSIISTSEQVTGEHVHVIVEPVIKDIPEQQSWEEFTKIAQNHQKKEKQLVKEYKNLL